MVRVEFELPSIRVHPTEITILFLLNKVIEAFQGDFKLLRNSLVRDKIVSGIRDLS